MKNEKVIMSIIIIAFSSLFLALTFTFPENPAADIGPAFLPRAYSVALYILAIALLFQGLKEMKKQNEETNKNSLLLVFWMIVVTVLYVYLIPIIGFYIITPIVMIILLRLTKVKNIFTLTLVPAGMTVFVLIFFEKLLSVPVPSGTLFS